MFEARCADLFDVKMLVFMITKMFQEFLILLLLSAFH